MKLVELREFDVRVRKLLAAEQVEYTVEYKIDGVAVSLVYETKDRRLLPSRSARSVDEHTRIA